MYPSASQDHPALLSDSEGLLPALMESALLTRFFPVPVYVGCFSCVLEDVQKQL